MEKNRRFLVLAICAAAMMPVLCADTLAWWHFDECEPGTIAPKETVFNDTDPDRYAYVYTIGIETAMSTLTENGGAYLPQYAKSFCGRAVFDPVSGAIHTNSASMRFRTARGGPKPDAASGRAWYGGALKFDGGDELYSSLAGTRAFTVEAFLCTTGGAFNTFAPIVGCVKDSSFSSFTSENWALYMEERGTLAMRFTTASGIDVWYSGNGKGCSKRVDDGAWHHVALTYDGEKIRVYVDYVLDKEFAKTGDIGSYGSGCATWIGGYATGDANYGARKFNGLIDEVRVSGATLEPEQFLRMQPVDMDPDEILRISFDPSEYGLAANRNLADNLGPGCQTALFMSDGGSASYDATDKAGRTVGAGVAAVGVENASSIHFVTSGTWNTGSYIKASGFSGRFVGHSNYTIECFFKTSGKIAGEFYRLQHLFKIGSDKWVAYAAVGSSATNGAVLVSYRDQTLLDAGNSGASSHREDATSDKNLYDGCWHHFALVVDGDRSEARTYIDGRLSCRRTGYVPAPFATYSIFIGCGYGGGTERFFDGWMDNFRVTLRALAPSEFLAANPVDSGDASLLALFENDYALDCSSDAAFSVSGTGEAREGGNAPVFSETSRGALLLDGTNGTDRIANRYSVGLNKSRVTFPCSDVFETDTCTLEFWAKFTGISDTRGSVAADATDISGHVPIMRFVRADKPSDYDWYLYRNMGNSNRLEMAFDGNYSGWMLPNLVVDGRWHHYALVFEHPQNDSEKTKVTLYYDYERVSSVFGHVRALPRRVAGHNLMLGEGSSAEPNIIGNFDALRFSRGVLDPALFLGRAPRGTAVHFR